MTRSLGNSARAITYLNLLERISQLTSRSLAAEEILRQILDELVLELEIQGCWIQFFDTVNEEFRLIISQGLTEEMTGYLESLKFGVDPFSKAVLKEKPLVYADVSIDPDCSFFNSMMPWIRSLAIAPFIYRNSVVGVMGTCSSTPGQFAEYELKLLLIVSAFVADIVSKLGTVSSKEKDLKMSAGVLALGERQGLIDALSHELQTPLTALIASAGLLAEETEKESSGTRPRLIQNILHSASSLQSRIAELLELSRSRSGRFRIKLKTVDFSNLVKEVVQDLIPVAVGKSQSLVSQIDPYITVEADEQRLEQILNNLLSNAIKFTPQGGKIKVRARKHNTDVIVEVKDTGKGIAYEEQQKLFRPYYRIPADRRRHNGLGLGLSITKELVELHSGKIWVESEPEKGSIFVFSLPLAVAKSK
jgi:K+-sensing histidine kinase KdpD